MEQPELVMKFLTVLGAPLTNAIEDAVENRGLYRVFILALPLKGF